VFVQQAALQGVFPWYAVRVRARREKVVATAMQNKGFQTFLPQRRGQRIWSDRIVKTELPLFPGYVFSQLDLRGCWLPMIQTPGVLGLVSFGGVPAEVDRREIEALRLAARNGAVLEPWPFLRVGQRVLVERGALEGLEGILLQLKKQDRLVLSVSLLQRSVAVEIERCWVRPIHSLRLSTQSRNVLFCAT